MTTAHVSFAAALGLAAALSASPALAADEHNHDPGSPATPARAALPRFAAVSDTFELVGVVDGRQVTVYLDRYADNSPVDAADIALRIGDARVAVTTHGDGVYRGALAGELSSGTTAVTASIVAGAASGVLTTELRLVQAPRPDEAHAGPWPRRAAWGAAALVGLATLLWGPLRTLGARRAAVRSAA